MGYQSEIQRRREMRLAQIKKKRKLPRVNEENSIDIKSRTVIKITLSFLLFVSIYLVYHVNHPYAAATQRFINEAMVREFNFAGIYDFYKEKFDGNPAILPTFSIKEKEQKSTNSFGSPVAGYPLGLAEVSNGILIETKANEIIVAIDDGIITTINKGEQGESVTILHKNGVKSTYSLLQKVQVEENAWVEPGDKIGESSNKVHVQIKKDDTFINPLEVISFD